MSYQVFANGNREYVTMTASQAADIAVTWKTRKLHPKLWKVIADDGLIAATEVPITTKAETAKRLLNT